MFLPYKTRQNYFVMFIYMMHKNTWSRSTLLPLIVYLRQQIIIFAASFLIRAEIDEQSFFGNFTAPTVITPFTRETIFLQIYW